jgi:hypothetical protein
MLNKEYQAVVSAQSIRTHAEEKSARGKAMCKGLPVGILQLQRNLRTSAKVPNSFASLTELCAVSLLFEFRSTSTLLVETEQINYSN